MCFVAGVAARWFIGGGIAAVLAFYILWEEDMIKPYMKDRFIVVFDHSYQPLNVGWHQTRSLMTLGGGKLTGMGLFNGVQTQSKDSSSLPNRHTDFIFSAIGEELGMVGCILALAILAAIIPIEKDNVARARLIAVVLPQSALLEPRHTLRWCWPARSPTGTPRSE